MLRRIWSAAALAAGVALGGSAVAGDDAVKLGRFQPSASGFAGAVKSAADVEAAKDADDDTELVHGWHKHRRYGYGYGYGVWLPGWLRRLRLRLAGTGYSSFSIGFSTGYYPRYYGGYGYGGYGYRGGYGYGYPRYGYGWGGYGYGGGGYGYGLGYSSYYRPGFSVSVYSAPRVYAPAYSYGYSSFDPWCDWSTIGGLASAVRTPATILGNVTESQSIPAPMPSTANGTARQLPRRRRWASGCRTRRPRHRTARSATTAGRPPRSRCRRPTRPRRRRPSSRPRSSRRRSRSRCPRGSRRTSTRPTGTRSKRIHRRRDSGHKADQKSRV